MSFWRSFSWSTASPVDTILEKSSFTLEELLEEEDIISELKAQNRKLVSFLNNEEILTKLANYMVTESTGTSKTDKYSRVSTEILCSDNWSINETLFQSRNTLGTIFAFIDNETLPPINTSYFAKVTGFLLSRKPSETISFLISLDNFLPKLLKHIHNSSSIMEILTKILMVVDHVENNVVVNWLNNNNLIPTLIDLYQRSNNDELHESATTFFLNLLALSTQISTNASDLCAVLENENNLRTLLQHTLSPVDENTKSSISPALDIIIEIVKKYQSNNFDYLTPLDGLPFILQIILENYDKFISIMTTFSESEAFNTTTGEIKTPFGTQRMKVLELLVATVSSHYVSLIMKLVDLEITSTCFELFFKYPWNNFIHIAVHQIIITLLSCEKDEIYTDLFVKVKAHELLAQAGNSEQLESTSFTRKGYMGIVTLLAGDFQNYCGNKIVNEALENSNDWQMYINGDLTETRKKENTIIGGNQSQQPHEEDIEEQIAELGGYYTSTVKFAFENGIPSDFAIKDFEEDDEIIEFSYSDEKLLSGIPSFQEGDGSIKFFDFFGSEMEQYDPVDDDDENEVPQNSEGSVPNNDEEIQNVTTSE